MGLINKNSGKDARVVKPAGKPAFVAKTLSGQPTMHETHGEWQLATGAGGLIKQSGDHVKVSGEKPGRQR